MSMIDFSGVYKSYEKNTYAVNNINLKIDEGEFVYFVGPSGCGKSTLMKLLMRELKPTQGVLMVDKKDIGHLSRAKVTKYRRTLGVVYQDYRLLKDRSVYDNVSYAMEVIDEPALRIRRRVPMVLKQVGLSEKYKSKPRELSGGEQQRTAIARALVNEPLIILADEPTGNLDHKNAEDIICLLESINARNTTVIVATHDYHMIKKHPHRVVRLDRGSIVEDIWGGDVRVD